jgi:hypothetical protein
VERDDVGRGPGGIKGGADQNTGLTVDIVARAGERYRAQPSRRSAHVRAMRSARKELPMTEPAKRAPTGKEIYGGLLCSIVFIALGVMMVVNPDMIAEAGDTDGPSGGKGRLLWTILTWIWSIPGGIVVLVLGALFLWGTFSKRDVEPAG